MQHTQMIPVMTSVQQQKYTFVGKIEKLHDSIF